MNIRKVTGSSFPTPLLAWWHRLWINTLSNCPQFEEWQRSEWTLWHKVFGSSRWMSLPLPAFILHAIFSCLWHLLFSDRQEEGGLVLLQWPLFCCWIQVGSWYQVLNLSFSPSFSEQLTNHGTHTSRVSILHPSPQKVGGSLWESDKEASAIRTVSRLLQ